MNFSRVCGEPTEDERTRFIYRSVLLEQIHPRHSNNLPCYLASFTNKEATVRPTSLNPIRCSKTGHTDRCIKGLSFRSFDAAHGSTADPNENTSQFGDPGTYYLSFVNEKTPWEEYSKADRLLLERNDRERTEGINRSYQIFPYVCYAFDVTAFNESSLRDKFCIIEDGEDSLRNDVCRHHVGHRTLAPLIDGIPCNAVRVKSQSLYFCDELLESALWAPHCVKFEVRAKAEPKDDFEEADRDQWEAALVIYQHLADFDDINLYDCAVELLSQLEALRYSLTQLARSPVEDLIRWEGVLGELEFTDSEHDQELIDEFRNKIRDYISL